MDETFGERSLYGICHAYRQCGVSEAFKKAVSKAIANEKTIFFE